MLQPCPRSEMCGEIYVPIQLNDSNREYIVQLHNDFRHAVAEGVFHQIPPGSNINALVNIFNLRNSQNT